MTITKKPFGKTSKGVDVELYTLTETGADGRETSVDIITYGAAIRSIRVPAPGSSAESEGDAGSATLDVALGFDDIAGYESNKGFHGAVIGRIGNRVANAKYTLDDKKYTLDANDGKHSLHGGFIGFDKQVWSAEMTPKALVLTLLDKEGTAAGYPGDMTVKVKYTLESNAGKKKTSQQPGCSLGIEYTATCTKDTPVNLTNHCYFNLAGHDSGSIAGHKLQILSSKITPVDGTLIPTGELMDVTGTPFDLRSPVEVAAGLESKDGQIKLGGGYDHNWVISLDAHRGKPALAAVLSCGGLTMECLTTKPGIQFYSGNMMAGETGKGGAVYSKRTGLCLETQFWPNSVNTPEFPAQILRRGEKYNHKTVYKFY